jgi:hypothetical protein
MDEPLDTALDNDVALNQVSPPAPPTPIFTDALGVKDKFVTLA